MTAVGVVGLGTMGSAIARRLLDVGHQVHGTNRTAARAEPLIARGLVWHNTPRDVAQASEVVISMVTDDQALESVVAGPAGVIAGLSRGQRYLDMSSVSPAASMSVADRVSGAGASMLDAPVSGSAPQVVEGTLSIMVGGDPGVFEATRSLLAELGENVTYVGGNGSGVLLKLAVNISLAAQTLAFSEGLLLAERGGIDTALAAEVMAASSIGSPTLRRRAPLMLSLPDEAWFEIALMDKDIGLALAEAQRLGVPALASAAAADALEKARGAGYGERDIAALFQTLRDVSDVAEVSDLFDAVHV